MVVAQGDVVWVSLPWTNGSEPAGRRPGVVLQADRFNQSRINTIVVAAITSNLRYTDMLGNVRLQKHEAGLPRASVVNVTQIATLDRSRICGKLGHLTRRPLEQVWDGLDLVMGLEPA